ncbi:hypothetical protein GCM10027167_24740 [Nocardia heshunensis]
MTGAALAGAASIPAAGIATSAAVIPATIVLSDIRIGFSFSSLPIVGSPVP